MKTLRSKFTAILVSVLVLNLVASMVSFTTIFGQKADGIVINLAGRQRMLSQKMSKQALMLPGTPTVQPALKETTHLFDKTLQGLIKGDRDQGLPPCRNPQVLTQLNAVGKLWKPFRDAMMRWIHSNGTDMQAKQFILAQNETLLAEMNKAVGLLEHQATLGAQSLLWTQGIVLVLIIALLSAAWLTIIAPLLRKLQGIIEAARQSSEQVASSAGEINAASQGLAQGATSQAANLDRTSTALREMAGQTNHNATDAKSANQTMQQTQEQMHSGATAVTDMASAMGDINRSADAIDKIIKTIEEIAFQTNLLALNAAVEAARAGDAGKGFAVVADEVRNLAQRSAEAARDTSHLIEETVERIKHGSTLVNTLEERFAAAAETSGRVAELVDAISHASEEQASSVKQVDGAVSQMDRVTQQNAATAEEAAAAAAELSQQSKHLHQIVSALYGIVNGNVAA